MLNDITLSLGYSPAKNNMTIKGIQRLIIHPKYFQFSTESVVGNTDVALIGTAQDIFLVNQDDPTQLSTDPWSQL